jgi:hypothetical protein
LYNRLQQETLHYLQTIAKDERLLREKNFMLRAQALDDMEIHVIDRLLAFETGEISEKTNDVLQYAGKIKSHLEEINQEMFLQIRTKISSEGCRDKKLMNLIDEYFDHQLNIMLNQHLTGYDELDIFLNGLLTYRELPFESKDREPGMVYYQKTPVRIVFELVKRSAFQSGDVFFDLGSGLGQVTMLVNLLSSVSSRGIEIEPAYCRYAESIADELRLKQVEFISADARYTDYSSGNIFFMYTPFEGKILNDVLRILNEEAEKRAIRVFTYGSCTQEIERRHGFRQVNKVQDCMTELAEFISI